MVWAAREGFEHDESTDRVLVRKTPIAAGGAIPAAFFSVSIKIMTAAWAVDLQHADKLVLLALADNANDEGMCYPSMRTVAAKCGMGWRTVQRAIQTLEEQGHLSRDFREGRSTVYFVHPCQSDTPVRESGVSERQGRQNDTPAGAAPHPRQSGTPPLSFGGTSPLAPRSPPHTPPLTPHTPHPKPSDNRQGNREELRAPRSPATAKRLQPEFDLTEDRRTVAIAERVDPEREFKRFRDHWLAASGANARKHDWDAAWRNWCRKAADMQVNAPRQPGVATPADPNAPKWTAVLIAVDRVKQADGNGGVTWADARRELDDDIAHQAIEQLGGYKRIADRDRFTTSELKRRFAELYEHFRALAADSRARTRLESP